MIRRVLMFSLLLSLIGLGCEKDAKPDATLASDISEQMPTNGNPQGPAELSESDVHFDPGITVTQEAAKEIELIAQQQGVEDEYRLRLGVKHELGGGFSYVLDISNSYDPEFDYLFESNGIRVAVNHDDARYLQGTILDFNVDRESRGFVFDNPNVTD